MSFKPNNFRIENGLGYIEIVSPKYGIYYAIIDTEDIKRVIEKCRWILRVKNKQKYARASSTSLRLHQFILNEKESIIDHIDRDGLNNTKINLRICTNSENLQNLGTNKSNKFNSRNVFYNKNKNKYTCKIMHNYNSIHIKHCDTLEEADELSKYARAYLFKFSEEYAKIKQESIPQWIKDKINKKLEKIKCQR